LGARLDAAEHSAAHREVADSHQLDSPGIASLIARLLAARGNGIALVAQQLAG
jgi:hypothetical protein